MARGTSSPRSLVAGIVRVACGALCAYGSVLLVARTLQYGSTTLFSVFAIGTFVAGLLVDALIGDAVRHVLGIKR